MRYEQSVEVDAPRERVWEVMIDVERWPEWTESVTSIERLDTGPFAVGSRARVRQPKFPPVVWEVTALDEGRSFTWEASSLGLRTTAEHRIHDGTDEGRCAVELAIDQRGPASPLARVLFGRITQRYLALEAAGLRSRSERTPH